MIIKTSAPGKLLLFGDHAVVYGFPCITTAVDKRLHVEIEKINGIADEIITPQVKENKFVVKALSFFKHRFNITAAVKIKTNGDFSHNVGLGSSSAVTVATFKALTELFELRLTIKELFSFSYQVNREVQGLGSGFDIAVATYGRTIYFVTGGKVIEPLQIDELPLVIGYSGVKANTPTIVRNVYNKMQDQNEKNRIMSLFGAIASLVEQAKVALIEKNWVKLGELMNENHSRLIELGVSTEKLDVMCRSALQAGAFGAKLSGAGGGDCMIALVSHEKRQSVEGAIQKAGGEIISVTCNALGVKLE